MCTTQDCWHSPVKMESNSFRVIHRNISSEKTLRLPFTLRQRAGADIARQQFSNPDPFVIKPLSEFNQRLIRLLSASPQIA